MRLHAVALLFTVSCGVADASRETAEPTPAPPYVPAALGATGPKKALGPVIVAAAMTDGIVPSCPIPASNCPARCVSLRGRRFEEAKGCYSRIVVGCWPVAPDGLTYSMSADLGCMVRDDGVRLETSGSVLHKLGPDWSGCSLNEKMPTAPACVPVDEGGQ